MSGSASAADCDVPAALPVSAAEFAAAMARLGGFEPRPILAVGVSGGADSLALMRLCDEWARAAGGRAIGLTVDHRLRPESAEEARCTAAWLGAAGIAHHILTWDGPYPLHGLPAAARAARYRLLGDWCRRNGVLHLAVAHHRDDQAETLLMRLGRGSGLAGLAGMAPLVEAAHYRLLRPLLAFPASRLVATLVAAGQNWVEDPTNRDRTFLRARIRHAGDAWTRLGLDPARLAVTAQHLARARRFVETAVEHLLAGAALIHPAGFVALDRRLWQGAPDEVRLRALAAVLVAVGGARQTPRFESLLGLDAALAGADRAGRTLGGCRVVSDRERILVLREAAAIGPPAVLTVPELIWDGRFLVGWQGPAPTGPPWQVRALGAAGLEAIHAIASAVGGPHLPYSVRLALPTFWREDTLLGVPHLGWWRGGVTFRPAIRFRPVWPATQSGFTGV